MKVFLIKFSYHKGKWGKRCDWGTYRVLAENQKEAVDKFYKEVNPSSGCGFRMDSIEEATGKPHEIKFNTVF